MWHKFYLTILLLLIYPVFAHSQLYVVKNESIPEVFELFGTWVPITWEPITVPFPAVLKTIYCPFGTKVKRGDKLFELQDDELPLKIQEAQLAHQNKIQAYQEIVHWTTNPEYLQAKNNLQLESQSLEEKKKHLQETKILVEMGGIAQDVLLQEQRDYAHHKQRFSELQQRFDSIQKKGNSLALEQANIEVSYAKMHLDKLKQQEQQLLQHALLEGTLYSANLFQTGQEYRVIKEGMRIEPQQWLGVLASVDSFGVTLEVSETWVDKIEQADALHLVLHDAFILSKIYSIEPVGLQNTQATPPKYLVKIQPINSPKATMKIGKLVKLQISNFREDNGLKIPLKLVFWNQNQPFVYKWNPQNKHMEQRSIELGTLNPPWIQVKKGLIEGDKIGSAS